MQTYYLYQKYHNTHSGRKQCYEIPQIFTQQQFLNYLQRELKLIPMDYQKAFDGNDVLDIPTGNYLHHFKRTSFGIADESTITTESFISILNN